jgi:N utilization substance protein A
VTKVLLDEDTRTMELIVPDDQLSLAIGRRGQNVRLAAKLTGWKIDIHSETKIREMNESARDQLARVAGLTEDHRELLIRYGFRELKDVADASIEDLVDTLAISEELAEEIIEAADEILTDELRAKYEREEENERLRAAGLPTLDEQEAAVRAAEQAVLDAEQARLDAEEAARLEAEADEAADEADDDGVTDADEEASEEDAEPDVAGEEV